MIRIHGQDLIRRILEGERYLAGLILEDNFNLNASPDFPELQKYLLKQKLFFLILKRIAILFQNRLCQFTP